VILHLAFSPDGRSLAVALAGTQGIRVLDLASGRELMADRDYGGNGRNVVFGPDGALYAVGNDGYVRRYGPGRERTAKVPTPWGRPVSIAINPAGSRIAIGYDSSSAVDIFEAAGLRHLAQTENNGVENEFGPALAVAWSSDGRTLFAGGRYQKMIDGSRRRIVRTFDADGRRGGPDVPVSVNTIASLVPCGNAIAFSDFDPAFGLIEADGAVKTLSRGRIVEMLDKVGTAFMVSADGARVRFGLEAGDKPPVLFDLAAGTIADSAEAPSDLRPPDVSLPVQGWQDGLNPTFAGQPIKLLDLERSRSLAARPGGDGFALGTVYRLRSFATDGTPRWSRVIPGQAAGVNLARDGSLVLAAYRDGTIRWHRWSDGKELLALFVERNSRRWVAWTPTGYYMASPGGEDLIGWHLNRGWEQPADFFPASRFRERFNRPDIVQLVLETLDEDAAVKRADETAKRREGAKPLIAQLPPVIQIADPKEGSRFTTAQVALAYDWRSPSGIPIDRIDVLIDGRPEKAFGLAAKPVPSGQTVSGTLNMNLPARDVEVALIAHAGELASEPARVKLSWAGVAAPPPEALLKPKLYALVMGVSAYAAPDLVLHYAAKDARDFAQALEAQRGGIYGAVATRVLTDRDVTRASVIEGLEWLEREVTSRDVGVVFIAGHGYMDERQTYWFLPADATPERARLTGIAQDDLNRTLRALAGKAVLFLDTCHAGGAVDGGQMRRGAIDINTVVNEFASAENGVVAFASSTGRESSVENDQWMNGAFTKALVEGLREGRADLFRRGTITLTQLDAYVVDRVKELTGGIQHPIMTRPPTVPDFPIAVVQR
jgi:hypothetical protein